MSKVFDYYNELDELDGPIIEPTDEELAEIELEIDELD
jgi:hypothetical protein|tara:strand:- start:574 stop:687 length:114 start_codon:yes stop_codon:yes gene_type:complete